MITITGVNKIVRYTKDFVISQGSTVRQENLYGNLIVWEYNHLVWSSTEQKKVWFSLIWD